MLDDKQTKDGMDMSRHDGLAACADGWEIVTRLVVMGQNQTFLPKSLILCNSKA